MTTSRRELLGHLGAFALLGPRFDRPDLDQPCGAREDSFRKNPEEPESCIDVRSGARSSPPFRCCRARMPAPRNNRTQGRRPQKGPARSPHSRDIVSGHSSPGTGRGARAGPARAGDPGAYLAAISLDIPASSRRSQSARFPGRFLSRTKTASRGLPRARPRTSSPFTSTAMPIRDGWSSPA
jgi:hypothetical protein